MAQIYYNGDKQVSKEKFDKERVRIIAESKKYDENEDNLIDEEDLDYYLMDKEIMTIFTSTKTIWGMLG